MNTTALKYTLFAVIIGAIGYLAYQNTWFLISLIVIGQMIFGVAGVMLLFPKFFKRKMNFRNICILAACLIGGIGTLLVVLVRGVPVYREDGRSAI